MAYQAPASCVLQILAHHHSNRIFICAVYALIIVWITWYNSICLRRAVAVWMRTKDRTRPYNDSQNSERERKIQENPRFLVNGLG